MSVVDKIASLAVSPEKEEAHNRLLNAERSLEATNSSEARLAKLQALVELDWFKAATKFADPVTHRNELVALAYSLYRLGKLEDLREAISQYGEDSVPIGARLSLAQAEYKAGNLENARAQFVACLKDASGDDELDIAVNISAIDALEGLTDSLQQQVGKGAENASTFDEAFNYAHALLIRGQVEEAQQALQRANGLAEEEDDRQSAIAQAAYLHLVNGDREEALKLLDVITSSSPLSQLPLALRIIVANNRLAATYEGKDLLDAHKALISYDDFAHSGIELNANQRQIVQRNQLKLLARVGISSAMRRALKHRADFPSDIEPLVVAYHATKTNKQIRKLAHSGDSVAEVCLAAYRNPEGYRIPGKKLVNGNFGQLVPAAGYATNIPLPSSPVNNATEINAYFESLRIPELIHAGKTLLSSQDYRVTDDVLAAINSRLSSVEDVSKLNFVIPQASPAFPKSASTNLAGKTQAIHKKKRSGKRKLPQNFDPNNEPNPERWLAKQDRSDYKPKKKKTSQATQGAAVVHEEPATAPSTSQVVGAKPKKKTKKKGKK